MEIRSSDRGKRKITRVSAISEDDHAESTTTRPRPRPRPSSLLNGWFEAQSVTVAEILSPQQLAAIENFIRSVAQEVVEIQVDCCIRSILSRNSQLCNDLTEKEALAGSGTLKFELFFHNHIASTIFTNNEIKAKNGKLLAVAIRDTTNSNAIIEIGPLSSALVEIVVLDGEFGSGQRGVETCWSVDDFNNNIVSQRVGKRPLIVGTDLMLYLENGVGFIKGLSFTDNSSWTKSKKFRFGVRIADEKILAKFPRIGEAVSEPFRVMDHRGEVYKKHHPPKRGDPIWRLEGIGKDGVYDNRLSAKHIKTVDDFLKVYHEDQGAAYLRKILGRVPKITWEKMISNALECDDPHVMAPLALDPNFGVQLAGNETIGGEAFKVGDEPMNLGDNDRLSENIEDQKLDGEVQDLASFNPTSAQNLMDDSLEEGQQKSSDEGHGLSQTLFSAHEFGGHLLRGPASYSPSFEKILAENYEAMGLGRGLDGTEEQDCSNMFYDDYPPPPLLPHGDQASIPYNHNHEVENATTPNQYYQERSWTELVPKPK